MTDPNFARISRNRLEPKFRKTLPETLTQGNVTAPDRARRPAGSAPTCFQQKKDDRRAKYLNYKHLSCCLFRSPVLYRVPCTMPLQTGASFEELPKIMGPITALCAVLSDGLASRSPGTSQPRPRGAHPARCRVSCCCVARGCRLPALGRGPCDAPVGGGGNERRSARLELPGRA